MNTFLTKIKELFRRTPLECWAMTFTAIVLVALAIRAM